MAKISRRGDYFYGLRCWNVLRDGELVGRVMSTNALGLPGKPKWAYVANEHDPYDSPLFVFDTMEGAIEALLE